MRLLKIPTTVQLTPTLTKLQMKKKPSNSINGDLNLGYQELEKKTETNVCCAVCNKKCLVSPIEFHVERCLNKSNEFVVQTD